jgi:hypothetical protein
MKERKTTFQPFRRDATRHSRAGFAFEAGDG